MLLVLLVWCGRAALGCSGGPPPPGRGRAGATARSAPTWGRGIIHRLFVRLSYRFQQDSSQPALSPMFLHCTAAARCKVVAIHKPSFYVGRTRGWCVALRCGGTRGPKRNSSTSARRTCEAVAVLAAAGRSLGAAGAGAVAVLCCCCCKYLAVVMLLLLHTVLG